MESPAPDAAASEQPGAPQAAPSRGQDEQVVPIFRVRDAVASLEWYARLGFVQEWEHRFAPGLPLYTSIARGTARIHLSEHTGDARPGTLVYLYVHDVDAAAAATGVTEIDDMDWGRDFEVSDPDGNRLRIGTPATP